MTTATPRSGPVPGPQAPKPGPPPGRQGQPTIAGQASTAGQPVRRIEEVPMTGAQSLVRSLEEVGCEVVFGIPGGTILPAYDPLLDSTKVRHVLVRHEQGAGHAATGYAQATGKVGVCMAATAATVPCMPGIPTCCGWLSGKAPRAISVVTTGMPVNSASSSSSAVASALSTPPPT